MTTVFSPIFKKPILRLTQGIQMIAAIIILAVIIVAALAFYSLYRRGRQLSQDTAYMPKPGTFDAERDAKWRQYDEDR